MTSPTRAGLTLDAICRLAAAGVLFSLLSSCTSTNPGSEPSSDGADEVGAQAADDPEWLAEYAASLQRVRAGQAPAVAPRGQPADAEAEPAAEPAVASTPAPARSSAQDAEPIQEEELAELVQEARRHSALVDQRLAVLVESFIDEGLALMERGELEAAHAQFASAYELDPANPIAADLYRRTGVLLGDEEASLGAFIDSARSLARARAEQRSVLVAHNIEQGQRAMAAGDPAAALRHFEDALTLVRFDTAAAGVSEADVAALVAAARYEIEQQRARRDEEVRRRAAEAQAEFEFAEANQRALRIEGLLRTADEAFLRDDFDDAITSLDEILRLDPDNEQALNLRRIATRARTEALARSIRLAYRREWVRTFDDLEQDTLIPNALITFPEAEEWKRIEDRGPRSFALTRAARPESDEAVVERLDEVRIPVDFQDATLEEVLDHLSQVSGVNMVMSPQAEEVALDQPPYNLVNRHSQPLSRILRIVLEDLSVPPMKYHVRDGLVRVVAQEESAGDYILEMYDVRDLTFTPTDHASVDFNLLPSGTDPESFTEGVEDDEPLPLVSEDTLLGLIQENIAPDSWTDDPRRTITQMPGTLVVKTTPDVHEMIRQLLADLRLNTTTLIHIETRFLEVEDSFLEDIGVDLRGLTPDQGAGLEDFGQPNAGGVGTPTNPEGIGTGIDSGVFYPGVNGDLKGRTQNLFDTMLGESSVLTGGGGLSLEALFLDDANVRAVLRAVSKYQNSNIVNAPSLTIRSGQRGNITALTNRTYVRDYEPEIAQSAVIAQPELAIVKDGIVLDVRAVASSDRRFITLELRPTLANLVPDASGNPLPEALVSLGTPNANNVTLQLPELRIQRLRTTATIPDGATLLLGGLKKSVEEDFKSSTPFLGDIPVLSFFFTRQGQYVSKRKLLILLTASILAPDESEPSTDWLR